MVIKKTSKNTIRPSTHEKILAVCAYLLMTYCSSIINLHTGFSQKRVRSIRELLKKDPELKEFLMDAIAIRTSTSKTIISSPVRQLHASFLLSFYMVINKDYSERVDLFKLARAYGYYISYFYMDSQNTDIEPITINEAWALANELRSREAFMLLCKACETLYFEAVHQKSYREDRPCPWCCVRQKESP